MKHNSEDQSNVRDFPPVGLQNSDTKPQQVLNGRDRNPTDSMPSSDRGGTGNSTSTTGDGPELRERLAKLERQHQRLRIVVLALVLAAIYLGFMAFAPGVVIQQTLMESEEIKLVDKAGKTRFLIRMYANVPVLQILDSNGKPRMSLGLRFDDTPFIDLSDKSGRTRATIQMTEEDIPKLELFDEKGETTFKIK